MSIFGAGHSVQNSDPDFAAKIARLKSGAGRMTITEKVNQFIEHEAGIDPKSLPLDRDAALGLLTEVMLGNDYLVGTFDGNSTGLHSVGFQPVEVPCPQCGSLEGTRERPPHSQVWRCYECGVLTPIPFETAVIRCVPNLSSVEWRDLTRIFSALHKAYPWRGDDGAETAVYGFRVTRNSGNLVVEALPPPVVDPELRSYPPGSTLRVERCIIRDDATSAVVSEYVHVGSLFDDREILFVTTMTPMTDLAGWTVVEQLQR